MKQDMSPELILSSCLNGVKLKRPSSYTAAEQNVKEILSSPFNVYFLDVHSRAHEINEASALTMRVDSTKAALGKSIADILDKENAERILRIDRYVMSTNATSIHRDVVQFEDASLNFLSIKTPWYDENDKIIGLFGCSILLGVHALPWCLLHISRLGLLHPAKNLITNDNNESIQFDLTSRQKECLFYLTRGMTIKEIAIKMHLSPRTVEHHLETVKEKLNCRNRSALIQKALMLGIMNS